MAVQRVSPEPDPPDGAEVRDGYRWKMGDPPYSDPVTVHHDAVVVHHPAVVHSFASVAVDWTVPEHTYNGYDFPKESGTVEFAEIDLGEAWNPADANVVYFQDPDGQSSVSYARGTGGWDVRLPSVQPADPWMGPFSASFSGVFVDLVPGDSTVSAEGTSSTGRTAAAVTITVRRGEVSPAWDEEVSPAWDEEIEKPPLRKISYFGDYGGGGMPFSSPPSGSGLRPDSLRGEAIAYLASGLDRMTGSEGAVWLDGDGRIASVPGLFSGPGFTSSPALDAYRIGRLAYMYAVRRPAAPELTSGAEPVAVAAGDALDWQGRPGDSPAPSLLDDDGADVPARGRVYEVADSLERASESGWLALVSDGPGDSDSDSDSGQAALSRLCLDYFMASASEVQPVPEPSERPVPGPYVQVDGDDDDDDDGTERTAVAVSASVVEGLFRRPPSDPAAMTRAWRRDAGWALDPRASPSFSYVAAAGCTVVDTTQAMREDAWERFDDKFDGYDFMLGSSVGGEHVAVNVVDAMFSWWAPSGSVTREDSWGTVRVSTLSGDGGGWWLVDGRTWADSPSRSYSAWLYLEGIGAPVNTEPSGSSPYWRAAPGVSEAGRFDLAYAGGLPERDPSDSERQRLPAVPRTSGPLATGVVPVSSPDDVAVRLVFAAEVVLTEKLVGDVETASGGKVSPEASDDASWRGSDGMTRVRRWFVSGFVPGYGRWTRSAGEESGKFDGGSGRLFSGPSDLADFVESRVLPAVGLSPDGLLSGSASYAYVHPPGTDTVQAVKWDEDEQEYESGPSFPFARISFSGCMVVGAVLRVNVDVSSACVFESGYCA